MKLFRKPNLKKSFSARTTGKWNRKAKRYINPFYGKRGMGLYTNPKKHFYNKGYSRTTQRVFEVPQGKKIRRELTQSPQRRPKGKSVWIGIGGLSAFLLILFTFFSCIGAFWWISKDTTNNNVIVENKTTSKTDTVENTSTIITADNSITTVEDNNMATVEDNNDKTIIEPIELTSEINANEPAYYSDFPDEELAVNRYVTDYMNSDTVCPFTEDNIEEFSKLIEEHKVLITFDNRFDNNVYLYIEGNYHTQHYLTLKVKVDGESDDELIIHLKDCISVIYPDLSEKEIEDIIKLAKEAGETGYRYNDDFKIDYECFSPSYRDISTYSYIVTYK